MQIWQLLTHRPSRIQSEHPAEEAHTVIRGGRVLGGLEPTRAFGDARYKWTREVQEMSVTMNIFKDDY